MNKGKKSQSLLKKLAVYLFELIQDERFQAKPNLLKLVHTMPWVNSVTMECPLFVRETETQIRNKCLN